MQTAQSLEGLEALRGHGKHTSWTSCRKLPSNSFNKLPTHTHGSPEPLPYSSGVLHLVRADGSASASCRRDHLVQALKMRSSMWRADASARTICLYCTCLPVIMRRHTDLHITSETLAWRPQPLNSKPGAAECCLHTADCTHETKRATNMDLHFLNLQLLLRHVLVWIAS